MQKFGFGYDPIIVNVELDPFKIYWEEYIRNKYKDIKFNVAQLNYILESLNGYDYMWDIIDESIEDIVDNMTGLVKEKERFLMCQDKYVKENNTITFTSKEEEEMNNKYLILKGNEKEIDQFEEYIKDYKQYTGELQSVDILGNDLFKAYWITEIGDVADHPGYNITKEKMDKIIEDFKNDDRTWDNIDQSINDYVWNLIDRIEGNKMEW